MEEMSSLEAQCKKLHLSEEEYDMILVEESFTEYDLQRKKQSLLGKICIERMICTELIWVTAGNIWKLNKPTIFKELGKNIFAITFTTEVDKRRVEDGKPWLFEKKLICA